MFEEPNPCRFDVHECIFFLKCIVIILAIVFGTRIISSSYFNYYFTKHAAAEAIQSEPQAPASPLSGENKNVYATSSTTGRISIGRTIAAETIEDNIPATGKFIGADLTTMKLYLFQDGILIKELPIFSKGRPGSSWETPSGLYKTLTKEREHFSSIGHVYMPYSMQFFGNFFIHGWPHYADGTEVPQGYSGGCIRLSNEDAEVVFNFSEKNTPIFVYDQSTVSAEPTKDLASLELPNVSATSYMVADIDTGDVYLERESDKTLPIASLSKLMTAMVANETISYQKSITITEHAVDTFGDSGHLEVGESFTVEQLLYPLLMESSNDTAEALSSYYGDTQFASRMNEKARAIGMNQTWYEDASGISANNTSTVYDLYVLTRYIATKNPFIFKITRTQTKTLTSDKASRELHNFNVFSADPNFIGGKTGHTTAAEDTMISLFTVPIKNKDHRVVFIVLQSNNREQDINNLRSWLTAAAQ